jgi:hypothetical protein
VFTPVLTKPSKSVNLVEIPCGQRRQGLIQRNFRPIYWNELDKGGHFAAFEQPKLFTEELRKAFRSRRA